MNVQNIKNLSDKVVNDAIEISNKAVNFNDFPRELLFTICKLLEERALIILSNVSRNFHSLISHDDFWKHRSRFAHIKFNAGDAKNEYFKTITNFCSFFLLNGYFRISGNATPPHSLFDLYSAMDRSLSIFRLTPEEFDPDPTPSLIIDCNLITKRYSVIELWDQYMKSFVEESEHDPSLDLSEMEKLTSPLKAILMTGIFETAQTLSKNIVNLLCKKGSVSELKFVIENAEYVPFDCIDRAICKKYSQEILLLLIDKMDKKNENDSTDPLRRALQQERPSNVIDQLMRKVTINIDHLEMALQGEYPLPIIEFIYDEVSNNSLPIQNTVLHSAFYGRAFSKGTYREEIFPCYPEDLIKTFASKTCEIEGRYLDQALRRRFSNETIKIFLDNVEVDELSDLVFLARMLGYPEDVLKRFIEKTPVLHKQTLWLGVNKEEGYSEAFLEYLLTKGALVDNDHIEYALKNDYSEALIVKMIDKVDKVEDRLITKAIKYKCSENILAKLKEKNRD